MLPDEKDLLYDSVAEGRDFLDFTKTDMEKIGNCDQVRLIIPFLEYENGFRVASGEGEVLAYHYENGGWASPGGENSR